MTSPIADKFDVLIAKVERLAGVVEANTEAIKKKASRRLLLLVSFGLVLDLALSGLFGYLFNSQQNQADKQDAITEKIRTVVCPLELSFVGAIRQEVAADPGLVKLPPTQRTLTLRFLHDGEHAVAVLHCA